jgi:hypothetical protein
MGCRLAGRDRVALATWRAKGDGVPCGGELAGEPVGRDCTTDPEWLVLTIIWMQRLF